MKTLIIGVFGSGAGVHQQAQAYEADHTEQDNDECIFGPLPGGRAELPGELFGCHEKAGLLSKLMFQHMFGFWNGK